MQRTAWPAGDERTSSPGLLRACCYLPLWLSGDFIWNDLQLLPEHGSKHQISSKKNHTSDHIQWWYQASHFLGECGGWVFGIHPVLKYINEVQCNFQDRLLDSIQNQKKIIPPHNRVFFIKTIVSQQEIKHVWQNGHVLVCQHLVPLSVFACLFLPDIRQSSFRLSYFLLEISA